jgi:phospholipase/carboxylesterase
MDPMVPADNAARLAAQLRNAGADVQHRTLPAGHGLSQADVALARGFLAEARAAIVSAA